MNVWILTNLAQLHCCDMKKNWLDFGDLGPIFKVTGGLRLLENGFSAPCLQNEWMDFDQTCTVILLRQGQELIRFWWSWPHFQGHRGAQIVGKWLVCTLSPEWMEGFWLNLYIYIVVTWKRTDYILVNLTHFQGHTRAKIVGKCLLCTLSHEGMDGFWPNSHNYIVVTWKRTD